MPPRRRNLKRGTSNTQSRDTYAFRGLITPASSAVFTKANVPSDWSSRGFKIISASVECVAYDSATANKLVVQPGFLQWRLLDPNLVHSASGVDSDDVELAVSNPMLFGPNPRRRRLPVSTNWYPPSYTGHMFVLDCLCPQDGWEGGLAYILYISVILGREPRSEKCKQFFNATDAIPLASGSNSL